MNSINIAPAEWQKHSSVWLAWPSHAHLWLENLRPAQDELVAFCEAIVDLDSKGLVRGEAINLLVPDAQAGAQAEMALRHLPVQLHLIPFGDIWLRDTGPVFVRQGDGSLAAARFGFNSWGGKYNLPHDSEVAERICQASKVKEFAYDFILEGGSIELDGEGTCLTTKQCLLNANRNPTMSQDQIEADLRKALGVQKVLWLDQGLLNDHTDGHIDTIVRFTQRHRVVCMNAQDSQDPNSAVLERIYQDLIVMEDCAGRRLEVSQVPSPGAILNDEGEIMPASYVNFYIANTAVIVPTYGSAQDQPAVEAIATHFPDRKTIGLSAKAILSGGGAFHCISQQQPR